MQKEKTIIIYIIYGCRKNCIFAEHEIEIEMFLRQKCEGETNSIYHGPIMTHNHTSQGPKP
jgi:hypothetical protein